MRSSGLWISATPRHRAPLTFQAVPWSHRSPRQFLRVWRVSVVPDREVWGEKISRGLVRISSITVLEIAYSFQNSSRADEELTNPPLALMPLGYLGARAERRAPDLQRALLDASEHRGVSIPNLLIAAGAEISGNTLLHVDSDFELIARYSGQRTEKLVLS